MIEAWHFVGATLSDGRPIPADGEWLRHEGKIELCRSGLHASTRLIDALKYAPGNTICRVECRGDIVRGDDKLVCRERRILWRIDGEDVLRRFARRCALDVIDLWDAPEVVVRYLRTGDESMRAAARSAAWDAAWDAARGATWDAARGAAWGATWDATWAAARGAAWGAAWDVQNRRLTTMVARAGR